MDDLYYRTPERVQYAAGGGGSYDGSYHSSPHYYSDGDNYFSHGGQVVYPSSATGRPQLPDVRLSVPMDSARCVEKVKEALDVSGVYSVHCDVPSQTVTVSGNVAPQALLKRVKHVKRKTKIVSYTSSFYNNSGHCVIPHHGRTTSAYGAPTYGSSYQRSGRMPSPPRDQAYYSRRNEHALARPLRYSHQYHDQYHTNGYY